MAILTNLMVRIGVDDDRVGRGVARVNQQFNRLGDTGDQLGGRMHRTFDGVARKVEGSFLPSMEDGSGRMSRAFGSAAGSIQSSMGAAFTKIGAMGPAAIAGIVAAIALLPAAGALASAGLVLGFGAAFAAIGLAATFANKGVKKEFTGLVKHVKSTMREISAPFVKTWHTILRTGRGVFNTFAPELRKAFKVVAPAVSRFVKNFGAAFEKLAPSIAPLGRAFAGLLDSIGPALPGIFEGIGSAITEIANTVAANPDLFASFVTGLLQLIPAALQFVSALTQIFVKVSQFMGTGNAFVAMFSFLVPSVILAVAALRRFGSTIAQVGAFFSMLWGIVQAAWARVVAVVTTAVGLVRGVITTGFNLVAAVVRAVWSVIHAIIFGNFEQVKAAIRNGIASISAAWSAFWGAVRALVSAAWGAIKAVVRAGIAVVKSVISSGIAAAKAVFTRGWSALVSSTTSGASRVMAVVRRIPGRIKNALGNLGGLLVAAGRRVVQGLINGITSMFGRLSSTASRIGGIISRFLPGSPVQDGPLRVLNRGYAGQQIAAMLARGMTSGTRTVTAAAAGMLGAAGLTGAPTPRGVRAAGAGAGPRIVIDVTGGNDELRRLIQKMVRINGGGDVQAAFGR